MRTLILAATDRELEQCRDYFQQRGKDERIIFRPIGIGAISAAFFTQKYIVQRRPDIVILGGIAGCFDRKIILGSTFLIRSEIQATIGVEEDNHWKDAFDMGLADKNEMPYRNGRLVNPYPEKNNPFGLQVVDGISVDEITTDAKRQKDYLEKYAPVLESMEGAAFHFVCLQIGIPFLQIRSVSNYVGERDKSKWNFTLALNNLNDKMIRLVENL